MIPNTPSTLPPEIANLPINLKLTFHMKTGKIHTHLISIAPGKAVKSDLALLVDPFALQVAPIADPINKGKVIFIVMSEVEALESDILNIEELDPVLKHFGMKF